MLVLHIGSFKRMTQYQGELASFRLACTQSVLIFTVVQGTQAKDMVLVFVWML
jgi:hypothetical protein